MCELLRLWKASIHNITITVLLFHIMSVIKVDPVEKQNEQGETENS